MASVFKRKGRRKYTISYVDETGHLKEVPGFRDKQASLTLAKKLEREAERVRAGGVSVDKAKLTAPLADVIAAHLADMAIQGRTRAHIQWAKRRLEIVCSDCGFATLSSIDAGKLRHFMAELKQKGRSPRTVNAYRDALVTLCNWCVQQQWLEANPVTHIPKAKGTKAKHRRAYTKEEFHDILTLDNQRRLFYLTAGLSGLRRIELSKLQKEDLDPNPDNPRWLLQAEKDKSRRKNIIPMLPELAQALYPHWKALPPGQKLFPKAPRLRTLNHDLERAGIAKTDEEGRHVDFHSFRYFFCTLLARHLPIQKVRVLMRHRDIQTTCNLYLDLGLEDVAESVWTLPAVLGETQTQTGSAPPPTETP